MDLEQKSIERIRTASEMSLHSYGLPLICTYSGGKDSDVQLELFKRAGIPFEVHNSHTTADAPQTVRHIRDTFYKLELQGIKCTIDYHIKADGSRVTMWNLIPKKLMPPTRFADFPKIKQAYIRAFDRMIEVRKQQGKATKWKTGEEVFLWWMEDNNISGQYSMSFDGANIIGFEERL